MQSRKQLIDGNLKVAFATENLKPSMFMWFVAVALPPCFVFCDENFQ